MTHLSSEIREIIEAKDKTDSENFAKVANSLDKLGSGFEKMGAAMMAFVQYLEKKN